MPEILAWTVRRLRHAKGITQEELAHRAGMDRSDLGTIERAEHKGTVVMVGRLAAALSVLPGDLLELPPITPNLAWLAGNP
ncbi:helix-turn-helix transcriptional regulator [Azospirillum sp. TSO22-1]|uniref:helix-turn-helix transcriptional regulator n=1 Tax=Azospirillum sp. TSO22-1 TaxID=716789 RepID=UPI002000071B|nr:helix-turn-helix transcriptional regulator [Azospirillum sp. TSO22-1]